MIALGFLLLGFHAQVRLDDTFEAIGDKDYMIVTTNHGDIRGEVQKMYNNAGEPHILKVTVQTDNYEALADVCAKLVQRQLDLGLVFLKGEESPRKRYLFYIEGHTSFHMTLKKETFYWSIVGNPTEEKSEDGQLIYSVLFESVESSREDED